jgi:hypothetical protein
VKLTQTIACSTDKATLTILNVPDVSMIYSADYSTSYALPIKEGARWFADTSLKANFFQDGRLAGINSSFTGQGETIIKAALGLAGAVPKDRMVIYGENPPALPICDALTNITGGMPLTLTYARKDVDLRSPNVILLDIADGQELLFERIRAYLAELRPMVLIGRRQPYESGAAPPPDPTQRRSDFVWLKLQKTSTVEVILMVKAAVVSRSNVIIPETETYELPIPKAALFGGQTFTLALSATGNATISEVAYGSTTGAAGLLNAATAGVTATGPQTTAEKTAEIQAEIDWIVAQNRLAKCLADPTQCN